MNHADQIASLTNQLAALQAKNDALDAAACELQIQLAQADAQRDGWMKAHDAAQLDLGLERAKSAALEAVKDQQLNDLLAVEAKYAELTARCQDVKGMLAVATSVLKHEIAVKLSVELDHGRARDLAAQVITVVAGRLDMGDDLVTITVAEQEQRAQAAYDRQMVAAMRAVTCGGTEAA